MGKLPQILTDRNPETIKGIANAFNVTNKTVYNALNGVNTSDLALRIRKRAKDMGLPEKNIEKVIDLSKKI